MLHPAVWRVPVRDAYRQVQKLPYNIWIYGHTVIGFWAFRLRSHLRQSLPGMSCSPLPMVPESAGICPATVKALDLRDIPLCEGQLSTPLPLRLFLYALYYNWIFSACQEAFHGFHNFYEHSADFTVSISSRRVSQFLLAFRESHSFY